MNHTSKLGLSVLGVAIVLGVLGDTILRATPWGLNVLVWIVAMTVAGFVVAKQQGFELEGGRYWLAPIAILLAAAAAWRDSPVLIGLDVAALVVVASLIALRSQSGRLRLAGVMEYVLSPALAGVNGLVGFPILLRDIEWHEIQRSGRSGMWLSVSRGVVMAIPLLLIFGSLFMAADAVFENIVKNTFQVDMESLMSHLLLIVLFAWIAGGYLRETLITQDVKLTFIRRPAFLSLGIVEIGVVLGLLDLLFLSFVVVQFRYFFGGARMVEVTAGLSYAEYARRGFFELVTVAALVLPLLLCAEWLLKKDKPQHETIFQLLAATQIVLLFIIMISAFQRMRLYQREYGFTELRLYTTAFMDWLAVIFLWFSMTVLRGQRQRFVFGALVTGLIGIAVLHVLNPDAFIVRNNIARIQEGKSFDAHYATSLSADAVPVLVESLSSMNDANQCVMARRILNGWTPPPRRDWRTWNGSRAQAWQAVTDHWTRLQQMASQPPPGENSTGRTLPPSLPGNAKSL